MFTHSPHVSYTKGSAGVVVGVIIALIVAGGVWWAVSSRSSSQDRSMSNDEQKMMSGEDVSEDASMVGKDSSAAMKDDKGVMVDGGGVTHKGSYEAYSPEKIARAATGDVVLFFRASWCPTCRALDANIKAHLNDIPSTLTILDVNYDDSTALKQKYGVTYQHTLVQVDAQGNQIAKWTNSPTLAALVKEVK